MHTRIFIYLLILSLIASLSLDAKTPSKNRFTYLNDTLVIKTEKVKGNGLLASNVYNLEFLNISDRNYFPLIYPGNIRNMMVACELVDFKPYWFFNMKKSKADYLPTFLKDYCPLKIDTAHIPSIKDNSVSIMSGTLDGKDIYIVDQNNNKNFRDDSIRTYTKYNPKAISKLIKCRYNIFNGIKMVSDSGWINIGTTSSGLPAISVAQHLEAELSVDEKKYRIEVINGPPLNRFCFENPVLALVGQNGIKKDSILKSEMHNRGEFVRLGDIYYRFADVSNDGKYITLIKEKDIIHKVGTQVGFVAPEFSCHTGENDSITLRNYKGKYLLLVNVSAEGPVSTSYEEYKKLYKSYGSRLAILCIDSSPDDLEKNIHKYDLSGKFLVAEKNSSIQKNYRRDQSSKTCFLINPEGRIADKFEISEWEQTLRKYF